MGLSMKADLKADYWCSFVSHSEESRAASHFTYLPSSPVTKVLILASSGTAWRVSSFCILVKRKKVQGVGDVWDGEGKLQL